MSSVASSASVWISRKKRLTTALIGLALLGGAARSGVAADAAAHGLTKDKIRLAESYGKVPLSFEPNQGQTDGRVQFLSRGPGYGIFLTPGEAVLSVNGPAASGKDRKQSVLEMKLAGADASAKAEAEDKLPGVSNYMRGTDQSKWVTEVPTYQKVKYAGVYPGVDLVFYGNQRQLEYDFVVAPGRDVGKIALEFGGATPKVDAAGDLSLEDGAGSGSGTAAKFHKPVVYQMADGKRVDVAGAYEVEGQRVRFRLGQYDHSKELVIDPVVTYLTYLGGSGDDQIRAIAVDSAGAAYVTGYTTSTDFPLKNATQTTFPKNAQVMFVSKLNQSGTSLVYSTYLTSNGDTLGYGIAVDSSGDAYVGGSTDLDGFPVTTGAFQTICGAGIDTSGNRIDGCTGMEGADQSAVLAKLSPDGTKLLYATYLGGNNTTTILGVTVNSSGQAYVTGSTDSSCGPGPYSPTTSESFQCFPTTNGTVQSATDINKGVETWAFFTVFDAQGANLVYSSVIGAPSNGPFSVVFGNAVATNANGIGFITGGAGPGLYVTDGSFQTEAPNNSQPAFVAAFDPANAVLLYSSFLGGTLNPSDYGTGIAADGNNNAYISGYTYDCDFPTTTGAYETEAQYAPGDTANAGNCQTGFVAKMNPGGTALTWATYLGGAPLSTNNTAKMQALALGTDNSVYVAGSVQGASFPVVNPVLPQSNSTSVSTVTHLSADGTTALFSSTLGGPSQTTDSAYGIALDSNGAMYVAGITNDQHLPTTNNVIQPMFGGDGNQNLGDGFVVKIGTSTPPLPSNGLTDNLLANPGAELGSIADWTPGGGGTATVDTGTFDPGISPHTGMYDFFGGADNPTDSLSQTVSIIQQGITAAQVDGGTLFANVSYWEQGLNLGNPSNEGSVTLTFLNASNAAISSVTIGPEDSHDGTWANVTGIPPIPVGTRSITYTMNFVQNQPPNNDAFIDDNVLSIHTNTGLTIFPSTLHFGSVMVGTLSQSQMVTVTNNQTTAITIQQIVSELGANPTEFGVSTYCPQGSTLAAGASCPVTITFAPRGVGPKSAGIGISTDSVPALQGISVDGNGTGAILQVNPGDLKYIAGNGTLGYTGDSGPAVMAELTQPNGVAFDPSGNLYIADDEANVVRKVDTTGKITTFAGVGTGGFSGDGGPATQAELFAPFSVASDKNGNIFIQDTLNAVIRRVDAQTGVITTFAGTPGVTGHGGDGGPATSATFNQNQGARFDSAGNLYVPQCSGASVRKIDTTGKITTVAGNFTEGYSGDGGQATAAMLQCPSGVAIDTAGNLYIADEFNEVIRKVDTSGVITTFAGTGAAGYSGDGGQATAATFNAPNDVVVDSQGNLYIADSGNNRVRKIDTTGIVTTAAGGLNSAGSAAVDAPLAVTVDTAGNPYFSDSGNGQVDEIFPQSTTPFPATTVGVSASPQTLILSNIGNASMTIPSSDAFETSGNTSDFSLTGGSCLTGATLAPSSGTCTLTVSFKPTATGLRTMTVMITDSALNSPQSFMVGGMGVAAGGQQTPVITWPTPAAITDTTALSATQLDATAADSGGNAVAGTFVYTPAAGSTLAPGTDTLSVTFTPTNTTAYTTATKTVQIVVNFDPSQDSLSPTTLTFPSEAVGVSSQPMTINVNATPGQFTINHTGDFSITDNCDATPPAACSIQVTFTPTATGTRTGTLTVTPTGGSTPLTAQLSGVGTAGSGGTGMTGTATTTSFHVTAGDTSVTTVAAGTVVLLQAQVYAGENSVSPAQVAFCDASAASCTGVHRLGVAQVNEGGNASYFFVPGIGSHSYRAMFLGTNEFAASASPAMPLTVTGTVPTTTTIAQSGTPGNYTLKATTVGAGPYPKPNATQSVTINLGLSSENYTLTGTGASTNNGSTYGNFYNTQGICTVNGSITTCDLTGEFTSTTPGYASGTYDFQTVFGVSASKAITSQTANPVGMEPNPFVYTAFDPTTTMTLYLTVTGGGVYSIPVVENGNFDPNLDTVGFAATQATCGGTSLGSNPCQEDYVGTVAGATYMGLATGVVTFEMATPPTLVGPTGTVSFVDTSNANAVLGTGTLGTPTAAFALTNPTGSPVTVGAGAYGVTTGDFNNDGFADVVVENYNAASVSVLLGKGDGTFQPQVTYAVGRQPERVLAVDLNQDGNLDLVVANTADSTISVLLGNGDGTFQAQVTYPAASPVGLGVMDINHDGIPDVVAGDYYANTMSVLLGKGDGTLLAAVTYPTGTTPQTVAEGDFNGDGNIDVVVGNEGGASIGVFLGNGDGTFQTMVTYSVGSGPQGVQVADFNGDGKLDIAVANHDDSDVGILLGNGDGTFKAMVPYQAASQPIAIEVGDFNGDGILDITVGETASQTQSVLLGKGDGTFQPEVRFNAGNFPYGNAVADFNGDGLPDVVAANFNDGTATIFLSQVTETAVATATVTSITTGTHLAQAKYPGDGNFTASVSGTTSLGGGGTGLITPVITWMPVVATIVYGTPLGASQLNATAATAAGVAIPGTFTYTPAAGAVLTVGTQTLSVAFTPTDTTTYSAATGTATITVTQATPVITWTAPAMIPYGTPLSATQLDATVAGVGGAALPGTLVYTPAAGAVLNPGTQTLSVAFTPTDAVDYTTATATVPITVGGLALTSISPLGAVIGSTNTTITLTGTGFVATSMALVNGNAIATTYVNGTTLKAVIPTALLAEAGTLPVTVDDPSLDAVTQAQNFTVVPPAGAATLTGPAMTGPGTQPSVTLSITNPYPLALTANFTLTFASASGSGVDDPSIQFSSGGRTYSYMVAANSTTVPPVQLQAGTDAGTITITATLTADGVDVTPTGLVPLVITVPPVAPVITGTTITRSGDTLTVVIHGYSNTREMTQAVFDFTAATGDMLAMSSSTLTLPATTLFGTWFSDDASLAYGSTFTYTQIFNTSGDATTVGSVKVTLTNSVGTSAPSTAQ